jgi:uncharacterized protein (DUF1697 family)
VPASSIYIALLRGVNLGPHKRVSMADLRELVTRLGCEDAQSLLNSGNLVFRARTKSPADLERVLEAETKKRLGVETQYFLRTVDEWKDVIARNPMRKEAVSDPGHLLVGCLKDAPDAKAAKALDAAIPGREVARVVGHQVYIYYPDGIGTSKLTGSIIDRALGTRGTARNWNTVMKLGGATEKMSALRSS